MMNDIIVGISTALYKEFGDEYEIYQEEIRQGLKEPCFFIQCIEATVKPFRGERYFCSNVFCIQYFPTGNTNMECNSVFERMAYCLEYIDASGDKMRGTKIRRELVDGVLNFFINYDCFVYRKNTPTETMEALCVEIKEKG